MNPKHNRLKDFAKKAQTTQVDLASKVGVDRGVIGRIARGQQLPTRDQAIWISKALGASVEEVFPGGALREDAVSEERSSAVAELVLGLETKAAEALAENESLRRLRDEIIAKFSDELSSVHEEKSKLEQQLADAQKANKKLQAERFGLQFESLRRHGEIISLKKQVKSLEDQASALKGLAVAGGGAFVLGALAALNDR